MTHTATGLLAADPTEALDQAFDWMAVLLSGSATEAEHQALAAWRAADARHEEAWQQLMQMQQRLQAVPPQLASRTLRTARAPAFNFVFIGFSY